jgi:hypothetical protein
MRAAARLILIGAFGGLALGACGPKAVTETPANDAQKVDIETLPVDESDAASNNELATGDDEADSSATDTSRTPDRAGE